MSNFVATVRRGASPAVSRGAALSLKQVAKRHCNEFASELDTPLQSAPLHPLLGSAVLGSLVVIFFAPSCSMQQDSINVVK